MAAEKTPNGVKFPFRKIYDANDNVVGGLEKNSICDANGSTIASLSGVTEVVDEAGKKTKVKNYSSSMGEFTVSRGKVFLNGAPFGAVSNNWIIILIIICAAVALIAAILTGILVAKPWIPSEKEPIIDIGDENGPWEDKIQMLPDTIYPGGEGQYEFTLTNPHDYSMQYQFDITQMYNETISTRFPIEFRYMRDGKPVTQNWFSSEELNESDFTFTVTRGQTLKAGIQWRWKFESGNDALDTFYGVDNGEYYLKIKITNTSQPY